MLSKHLTEPSAPAATLIITKFGKNMDSEEPSLCVEKVASLGGGSSLHLDVGEPEADTVASEQDRFEVAEPKVLSSIATKS